MTEVKLDSHSVAIIAAATALSGPTIRRCLRGERVQPSTRLAIKNAIANLASDARKSVDRALASLGGAQ